MAEQLEDIFTAIEESNAAESEDNPVRGRDMGNTKVGGLGFEGCTANWGFRTGNSSREAKGERGTDGPDEEVEREVYDQVA